MDSGLRIGRIVGRPIRTGSMALLVLLLVSAPAFAACSAAHDSSADGMATAMPAMHDAAPTGDPALSADQPVAGADALWAARPDYVRADPVTEAAYHYAVTHPHIVAWMPCYCGCGGMGHQSNLDCYLRPGQATFEEHASYCDVCVQITLKTRDLANQGKTLREIRTIVDQTWGGSIPGTPTALPPV
jgi:hypothetical protein